MILCNRSRSFNNVAFPVGGIQLGPQRDGIDAVGVAGRKRLSVRIHADLNGATVGALSRGILLSFVPAYNFNNVELELCFLVLIVNYW